jgi:SAM-dependent methyltransferase
MGDVFKYGYADQYDDLYGDKDYEAECDVLEAVFRKHLTERPRHLLDLGCGTGNHSIPLARRGYDVTGVDLSNEMLSQAREKAAVLEDASRPDFQLGDVRKVQLEKRFDAVLMMFAVLGYQQSNSDVAQTLANVSHLLQTGGLFIFDVWYGPAVLAIRPGDRVKVIPKEDGQLIRSASGELDTFRHLGMVNYRVWRIRGDRVVSETQEHHVMRYFFPQELAYFIDQAGMQLLSLTAFPSLDEAPSDASWNVLGVAQRV